jgi:hypothetical protein
MDILGSGIMKNKLLIIVVLTTLSFSNSSRSKSIDDEIQDKFNSLVSLEYQMIDTFKGARKVNCITKEESKKFDSLLELSEREFSSLIKTLDQTSSTVFDISKEMASHLLDRFVILLSEKHSYERCDK